MSWESRVLVFAYAEPCWCSKSYETLDGDTLALGPLVFARIESGVDTALVTTSVGKPKVGPNLLLNLALTELEPVALYRNRVQHCGVLNCLLNMVKE